MAIEDRSQAGDVTNPAAVDSLVTAILVHGGGLDIPVSNSRQISELGDAGPHFVEEHSPTKQHRHRASVVRQRVPHR
jgi:NAD(P)-dependent dehydrogenase (short-subunit alcohol dehydrogenase family)